MVVTDQDKAPSPEKASSSVKTPRTTLEEQHQEQISEELDYTSKKLREHEQRISAEELDVQRARSWEVARETVKNYRPIPWVLWRMIRSVYARPGVIADADPMVFTAVNRLIYRAVADRTLGRGEHDDQTMASMTIRKAVHILGVDVAASVCLVHTISRRIARLLAERIWRPLIDDALLRAQIGYHVGACSESFGHGRGMLAGFSGRSGLAVLIAAGKPEQSEGALELLAKGVPIRQVGLSVYGCEPLHLAALILSAGGCSRDAAYGTASYALERADIEPNSSDFQWLAAFSITEHLRMGQSQNIDQRSWQALNFNSSSVSEMVQEVRKIQRRGHNWSWLTWPQMQMEQSP